MLPLTLCFILVSIIFFLRYPVKFFIFGRVVFFIDTVSMVVYTTICAKLRLRNRRLVGGGIVRRLSKYLIAGVATVSIFVCPALFCFRACRVFCLCYAVVVNFKGKEIK